MIVEGDRLYGDGVNIAARIEGLAEGDERTVDEALRNQEKRDER